MSSKYKPVIPGPNACPSLTASVILMTAPSMSTCDRAEMQRKILIKWHIELIALGSYDVTAISYYTYNYIVYTKFIAKQC